MCGIYWGKTHSYLFNINHLGINSPAGLGMETR
jgi:hypothetical protein